MKDQITDYPYTQKGVRAAPDERELRIFMQTAVHEGGAKGLPAPAKKFARRFTTAVMPYPEHRALPNWLRAMIEKKASVEDLTQTLRDRLYRAPSEENQELALLLANEIARMPGGAEALAKHTNPELLARLSGKKEAAP